MSLKRVWFEDVEKGLEVNVYRGIESTYTETETEYPSYTVQY